MPTVTLSKFDPIYPEMADAITRAGYILSNPRQPDVAIPCTEYDISGPGIIDGEDLDIEFVFRKDMDGKINAERL